MATRADELLKAAGEPTRLRILNLLQSGSICVCDLQAILNLPQSTVSRHLAALRHAGLVLDARLGPRVLYSLAPSATPMHQAFYEFLRRACQLDEELLPDLARLKERIHSRQSRALGESA